MPNNSTTRAALGLALLLLGAGGAAAQSSAPAPKAASLAVAGPWPHVTVQVARVARIDDTHAVLQVRFTLDPGAPPTLLSDPSLPIPSHPQDPIPAYSMEAATLSCDDQTYRRPEKTRYMTPSFVTRLIPGQSFLIPLPFEVPPAGTPPPVVTLRLPQVSTPLENILIPNEITP